VKKMKILWLNWRCWLNPAMGGAEVFTHEVAKRWANSGHEVTLFTSRFNGSNNQETLDGVKIIRAGGRFTVYREAKKFYSKYFSQQGFDVIIDEINTQPFFAQNFVNNNEKVVALIHQLAREYWFYETPFPVSYIGYHFLENHWLKQYINIPTVTVSESTKKDLLDLGFKDVSIVPEGLNFQPLSTLSVKESKPIVVFSGRLKPAKRPDHAMQAFKLIKDKIPEAEMWVFGDGPLRKELQRTACADVKFFGNSPSEERRNLIEKSWVLIAPGLREGWGLNVTEANALGVPSVAYDVPGLRDSIRNGETGLLVEAGNIKALADKTIELLQNSAQKQKLRLNALKYAKEFNWDKTAKEFIEKIKLE
jgi:glycosyltransferase involved in cell wall biosynthesis